MSPQRENESAEARAIMSAIRELETNPQLMDQARVDIPAVLERLALSGTVRHAVAATLTLSVTGVLFMPAIPTFWSA